MTFAFPETGAERSSTPCPARIFRSSAEPSREIEEHSTTMRGTRPLPLAFDSRPFGPAITSLTSSKVETMQNTMSQPARSVRESAIFAPSFASGSAFAGVRFQTAMSQPDFASRRAISKPMRPAPIQPSLAAFAAINSALLRLHLGAGSITASTVPTGTVLPASTRITLSTPLATAGISVVTLSVSTSKSGSSARTTSPTFLYQLATVPSVTVSPSCGMITSIASAFGQQLRASERLEVLALGHLALVGEQALVLEEHHRIGIADRRGEQPLRVGRIGRRDDLEAGNGHRPVLHALRMLRAEAGARAV